jgi:hypothetical protein
VVKHEAISWDWPPPYYLNEFHKEMVVLADYIAEILLATISPQL